MFEFLITFTLIGAVAGAACGFLSYEPQRRSRRGIHYRDIAARRSQTATWSGLSAIGSLIFCMLILSALVNNGVSL